MLKLSKLKAEKNLADFVRGAWPILEPVTKLSWSWHLDLICEHLTLVRDNKFRDVFGEGVQGMIVNVPPRTMKSLLITVFFPAWVWLTQPARRFMSVSYSKDLATQHSVLRRNVMTSTWYQGFWRDRFKFAKDQNLKTQYENNERGTMFSTAMHATATGLGGDILIFDDPLNPDQALSETERESVNTRFDNTFRTRLNDYRKGIMIVVMQRLHELDLTGHLLTKEKERWIHLKLPATAEKEEKWIFPVTQKTVEREPGELLWSERLPKIYLDGQTTGLGTWTYAGQYQQNPAPLEGGIIKRAWIKFYKKLPSRFDLLVQSWDCTFKDSIESDYVSGTIWGRSGGKFYMLPYRVNARMDFGPTLKAVQAAYADFPWCNAVLIEDKANGPAIVSELRQTIPGVLAVEPDGGKLSRAQAMAPLWESGAVELPDPECFDVTWMEAYIHEICTFPKAAHDDDMDSTSQALNYMRRNSHGLLEMWKSQADAKKREAEQAAENPPAPKTEQEVIRELSAAQLEAAALVKPSADTMKKLGAVPGEGAKAAAGSLGLLPKVKAEAQEKKGCPRCGNQAVATYGDYRECSCKWNSRMTPVDFLVKTDFPETLNQTLLILAGAVSCMVKDGDDFATIEGYYVARVFGDPNFFRFACEHQGYCEVIRQVVNG